MGSLFENVCSTCKPLQRNHFLRIKSTLMPTSSSLRDRRQATPASRTCSPWKTPSYPLSPMQSRLSSLPFICPAIACGLWRVRLSEMIYQGATWQHSQGSSSQGIHRPPCLLTWKGQVLNLILMLIAAIVAGDPGPPTAAGADRRSPEGGSATGRPAADHPSRSTGELGRLHCMNWLGPLHRSKNDICRGIESALIRKDRERDLSALWVCDSGAWQGMLKANTTAMLDPLTNRRYTSISEDSIKEPFKLDWTSCADEWYPCTHRTDRLEFLVLISVFFCPVQICD